MPTALAETTSNVFQATPATAGQPGKIQAMALGRGTVNLSNNWVSPNATPFWAGHLSGAVVNGWGSNLGAGQSPMFMNAPQHDYRPASGSPLVNAGNGLGYLPAWALPTAQPGPVRARQPNGLYDIGAFEF
jgi:hypothetical protein